MKRGVWLVALAALLASSLVTAATVAAAGSNTLTAKLTGSHEVGPVATGGWGSARVVVQDEGSSVYYQVDYAGLSGPVVAAHIHLGAIGANGPIMLPLEVGPSPMHGTLTSANFTGANGLTWTQALDAIRTGGAYVNLHTAAHPGGEVRGQLYDSAAPQTYTIQADAPAAVPAGHLWGYNDFFPRAITVSEGSVVKFNLEGFHTATILPHTVSVLDDMKANGIAINDPDDTVRNVNGTTHAIENIGALMPAPATACGTDANPCTFDGTAVVNEPISLGPPTPARAIAITAPPGAYIFHCRVHPGMTGTINVVSGFSPAVTSPDDLAADASATIAADTAAATRTEKLASKPDVTMNRDGTRTIRITAGTSTPDGRVALLEFLPSKVLALKGDKIVFIPKATNEPHTVTFPTSLHTDVAPSCESTGGKDTPAAPTVIPPTGPQDFACADGSPVELEFGGGNGVSALKSPKTVSDSGLVASAAELSGFGLPLTAGLQSWTVTTKSAAEGHYTYVCQIHDGMAASIDITHLPAEDTTP